MPAHVPVSAMIFTLNEEIHLPSCLECLRWTDDVIVIDSFSNDRTELICREAGVRFFQHAFDGFGRQRMWALENAAPRYPWVLVLDADERVTPELAREMGEKIPRAAEDVGAFRLKRRFHLWGRWLRHSSLYPSWVVRLVRVGRVRYVDRGHAETQVVSGRTEALDGDLIDENLKGLEEWFERQNRYSTREAQYELSQEVVPLRWADLVAGDPLARRAVLKRIAASAPFRPTLYFLYSYLLRGGFLEGREGLMFCAMKASYQRMIVAKKHEARRSRRA